MSFHESTVTSTVDSVIPLAGAADPTAFANSANPSARSGFSFADICAALSLSPEIQSAVPAPALPSKLPVQIGNTTTPANIPGAKGPAKNTPPAGANPPLAFLVPLPPIPLPIPVSALPSAPPQMAASPSSVDSTNQADSGSDGTSQTTNLTPVPRITTSPTLTPGNTNASRIAAPIPSRLPAVNQSPEASAPAPASTSAPPPAPASGSAQDPWFLSSPVETDSAPSGASSGSPSVLPNGSGAHSPTVVNMPTDATDDQAPPEIASAARETLQMNAEMPAQAPVAATAAENPSFSSAAQPSPTIAKGDQPSQNQAPAAQVSPAVVETISPPAASPENVSQVAATSSSSSSSQTAQTAPADEKAQPRSGMQPRSPLEQEELNSSSLPGTLPASSAGTTTSLASHAAVQGLQPAPSVRSSTAAHGSSNSVPMTPAATNLQTMSAAENSAASMKNNPASQQPGNASVSTPRAQDPATSAATSSKNDSGGDSSDSQQHKDSPNAAVSAVDSLPSTPSPAFTIAAPSAQVNVPQPSSSPDAGPKSNAQTSAGVPDNAPHPSLPGTPEAPPAAAASPLQMAQMANKAGQSEMRIGLNTAEFGSVEVRTTVHANDVGVQIGSEKGDLRSLLTPELPGIASTLQQQDLRVTQVSFHQQGFAFANNSSSFSGGNSQPRSFGWKPQSTVASSEESSSPEPVHAPEPAGSQRHIGLSILA